MNYCTHSQYSKYMIASFIPIYPLLILCRQMVTPFPFYQGIRDSRKIFTYRVA